MPSEQRDNEANSALLTKALISLRLIDETGNQDADAKILEAEQAIRAALAKL